MTNWTSLNSMSRRDLLRTGGVAAAGLAVGGSAIFAQKKRPLRIDAHAHVWTKEYLDLIDSYGASTDTSVQRDKGAGPSEAEMEKRFAQMDTAKVEMQVLSVCPQAPHFENKEHAVKAARMINDLYADVVRKWPKKFKALAALPFPHVDECLKELERATAMGTIGVSTTTMVAGRSIADPAFAPVYEELNRRGTVLYVHPAGVGALTPMIAKYNLTWMIGAPIEDTISTAHLIIRGIPSKYPKLKIVNSHLGGALPMVLQRMDNQFGWENPGTPEKPSIAAKRMWYDTVAHAHPPAIRAAVDTLGADRIILGTDFPYESGALYTHAITYVSEAGLKQNDITNILDYNGAGVLGLA